MMHMKPTKAEIVAKTSKVTKNQIHGSYKTMLGTIKEEKEGEKTAPKQSGLTTRRKPNAFVNEQQKKNTKQMERKQCQQHQHNREEMKKK
eukprot:2223184-Ditylum_brightwellii.AAC.1